MCSVSEWKVFSHCCKCFLYRLQLWYLCSIFRDVCLPLLHCRRYMYCNIFFVSTWHLPEHWSTSFVQSMPNRFVKHPHPHTLSQETLKRLTTNSYSCVPCCAGTYSSVYGATECTSCTRGHSCAPGSTSDVPCPAGYYCQYWDPTNPVQCPIGHYCPPRRVEPVPCPLRHTCGARASLPTMCNSTNCVQFCPSGQYVPTPGGMCTGCPAGNYCPVSMQNISITCPPAYYCPANTAVPIFCSGRTFSSQGSSYCSTIPSNFPGAAGYTELGLCAAGFYCVGGLSMQQVASYHSCDSLSGSYCPRGTISPNPCPAGSYCSAPTTIAPCPAGSYCPPGSVFPFPCGSNYCPMNSTWSPPCLDGSLPSQQNTSTCVNCPMGSYTITTSSTCVTCPNGQVTQAAGLNVCACMSGKYRNSTAKLLSQVPGGYNQYENYCVNCPAHSSTVFNAPAGFSQCACDGGYYGTMQASSSSSGDPDCYGGYCLKCTICPAGTSSAWNSTTCSTCSSGTYALAGWSSCQSCPYPSPVPGPIDTWTFNPLGGNPTNSCNWTCASNNIKTFDGYCMQPQQITERCAKVCESYQYVTNCSAAQNGTCRNCNGSCGANTGLYNVGCGGLSNGTCASCFTASACSADQYIPTCPGLAGQWPELSGQCESCMARCDSATEYNEECTLTNKGTCKKCDKVCSTDQYVVNCGGNNRKGTCSNCSYCNGTSYAKGCGGMSQGSCELCASGCPKDSYVYYAKGCSVSSAGVCTTCIPQDDTSYIVGCGLNSPGQSFKCAYNCPSNHYALGCGGRTPGICTPCVSTAQAGYYADGCGLNSPGGNVKCPENTYSATSGANSSSACRPCPLNSGSAAGSAACQCNTGTSSPSGSPSDCTYCLPGTYQNLPGATSCLQCPYGKYSKTAGANMVENCAGCSETIPANAQFNGAFSVNNNNLYCEWDCITGYRKNGNTCVSTAPPPPPPPSSQPSSPGVSTPAPPVSKPGNTQTTQKQSLTTPTVNILTTPQPSQNSSDTSSSTTTTVVAASVVGALFVVGGVAAYVFWPQAQAANVATNSRINVKISRTPGSAASI